MLERDDAIALRDWCREVAPLVASADTGLFLAAADAISFETLRGQRSAAASKASRARWAKTKREKPSTVKEPA